MGPTTVILVAALFILTLVFLRFWSRSKKEKKGRDESLQLPPGYSNNIWSLIIDGISFIKPHPAVSLGRFLDNRMSRYGRIFTMNLLGEPAIVSTDAELNRFILKNEMKLFVNCWPQTMIKVFGRTNMTLQVGDAHKQLRSPTVSFFSPSRLQTSMLSSVESIATTVLSFWEDGSIVSAVDVVKQYTFRVILKQALSLDPRDPRTQKMIEDYEGLSVKIFMIQLNLPGTRINQFLKSRENIVRFIKQTIEERTNNNAAVDGSEYDDFLSWVMKHCELSNEQTVDLLMGIIYAGGGTTSTLIASILYFLGTCPNALDQLREEHLQIVRSRKQGAEQTLTWSDYKQMEFTQCVINEAMRPGNISRFLLKKATTDIQFKGYHIPQGCKVILHLTAMHLDPSTFEDPQIFNPWRWKSSSGLKTDKNFMPFGGGPRLCPGADLARLEIAVFLHHLVLKYDWELMEDDFPVASPMVNFPRGLPIKLHAFHF